jgi:hypothetical protein
MPILPPTDNIPSILKTPHCIGSYLFIMTVSIGANFGVDYGLHKDSSRIAIVNGINFWLNILIMTAVISFFTCIGSGGVTKRILEQKAAPIHQSILCDSLFKRIVFFSMAVPRLWDRVPRFIVQSLVFPGLFTATMCYLLCWFVSRCPETLPNDACVASIYEYCGLTALWKAFIATTVFLLNYIAAHNIMQPDLQEALLAESASPLTEETSLKHESSPRASSAV